MHAVFKSSLSSVGRRTILLAACAVLAVLGFVAAPTHNVLAAAITGITYTPSGVVAGSAVASSSTLAVFTPTTAITNGSTITLTFPAGTTLTGVTTAAHYTIIQAGGVGVATVPTAVSGSGSGGATPQIVFTVAAASLHTTGLGAVTIATTGSLGATEIVHPILITTTGSFVVATSVGDTGSISNVTFIAGAATAVFVETAANGSGSVYGPASVTAGTAVTVYSITRDTHGNFVANVAATAWSLTGATGGVVNGDLVGAGGSPSAVFTGHLLGTATIHVTSGVLTAGNSGLVTVVAGVPVVVFVETAANGSGSVYGPASVTAGTTATVYSITRDAQTNFVANVAATAWSLTSKTGGVVNGDLVGAGGSPSAVFTGHLLGTATIHVTSGVLTAGNSGLVTVVAGAATAVFVETAANGSGAVYGPATVYVNNSATVYSITRDAQTNFVANVAATAWSLTSKTGGVVNGDLVGAGGSPSAVFTGTLLGSAVIHVTSGGLTAGDSGTVTVARSSGGGGSHTDQVVVPASVDLSLPNGGNTLVGGSVVGITWSSVNGVFVKYRVSYSSNNGNTWTVLSEAVPNTSYSWTVPTVSTTQGLIKVEGIDTAGAVIASDVSASVFTVNGTTTAPAPVAPPTSTTPPVTDDTVKGAYDADTAKANNPDFNTNMNLPAAAGFTAWCVSGSLIKSPASQAVYYCGKDGKRYVFVNDKAYFSWYPDFSTVQTISATTLAEIAIGGNITYRPGTRMIKIQSDPRVYTVARGGVLRWVETETAAVRLFGANWNKMIDDVSDSFFVNYKIGDPITY